MVLGGTEKEKSQDNQAIGIPVQVMIDGPYGGCSIDLGEYESALLFSGGSGVTFTLGMLDDIVGRVVRLGREDGERTKRIEFVWCIRSFGGHSHPCTCSRCFAYQSDRRLYSVGRTNVDGHCRRS